jgi:hypothetical protein
MVKVRTLLGIAALALTLSAAQAATLVDTDFSKNANGWVLDQVDNNAAILRDPQTAGVSQVLALTQNKGGQTGIAWTQLKQKVDSFSFIADLRIRWEPVDDEGNEVNSCPADGVALIYADAELDAVGGGGGGLGLTGGNIETFTAFVINTWRGAGNGNDDERESCTTNRKFETFEFFVATPEYGDYDRPQDGVVRTPDEGGSKINQVNPPEGMRLVNGGFYRYQWNVDGANDTMAVYVTGLDENNKQFQKVKVLEGKFDPAKVKLTNFEGRWGMSAATGGAVQHAEVARARIDSPMIDPL